MTLNAFGPVPSRRLGQSLGINNIPAKTCSYSCLYCQLGNTTRMLVERAAFYQAEAIAQNVKDRVQQVRKKGELIDYLTFVPDGEPTLDANLGTEIELLRPLGIKIAVITNASLIWRKDVRRDLQQADWVSLKIDTVSEETWHRINRPHRSLRLEAVLAGMLQFVADFSGELATETMLIEGINDGGEQIERTSDFLAQLKPDKAYLAVPTRPPAEKSTKAASEQAISMAHQVFGERLGSVEYLIGYEGDAFACTGNVTEDLLSITSVHPMREEAVAQFLSKAGAGWEVVEKLIRDSTLVELIYQGQKFYMRRLPGR
jgi:wyosine [tRNA(Phe)-imidazoG37] synthetase (radical SAM superfamily)